MKAGKMLATRVFYVVTFFCLVAVLAKAEEVAKLDNQTAVERAPVAGVIHTFGKWTIDKFFKPIKKFYSSPKVAEAMFQRNATFRIVVAYPPQNIFSATYQGKSDIMTNLPSWDFVFANNNVTLQNANYPFISVRGQHSVNGTVAGLFTQVFIMAGPKIALTSLVLGFKRSLFHPQPAAYEDAVKTFVKFLSMHQQQDGDKFEKLFGTAFMGKLTVYHPDGTSSGDPAITRKFFLPLLEEEYFTNYSEPTTVDVHTDGKHHGFVGFSGVMSQPGKKTSVGAFVAAFHFTDAQKVFRVDLTLLRW